MDSRRLVVSSAASCLLSWRLAVFIFLAFYSGLLGEAAPLACWLLCEGVEHVLVGIRASRARRVDHNAGAGLSQGLPLCLSRGATAAAATLEPKLAAGSRSGPANAISPRNDPEIPVPLKLVPLLRASSLFPLLFDIDIAGTAALEVFGCFCDHLATAAAVELAIVACN